MSVICLLGQQLKHVQQQNDELLASFLKVFWDVTNKNQFYCSCRIKINHRDILNNFYLEELADVERLKRIFRGYFADHETYTTMGNADLQAMVEQRAHECALKYRQKLRNLHLSQTDYQLDIIQTLTDNSTHEQFLKSSLLRQTNNRHVKVNYMNSDDHENQILSISIV